MVMVSVGLSHSSCDTNKPREPELISVVEAMRPIVERAWLRKRSHMASGHFVSRH